MIGRTYQCTEVGRHIPEDVLEQPQLMRLDHGFSSYLELW